MPTSLCCVALQLDTASFFALVEFLGTLRRNLLSLALLSLLLGWIKKQRKRRHSKSALWKKAATLQEKVEEMCRDYLMWKQIRANGDIAVRQGYFWLGTPETKIYNGLRDGRELDNCLWQLERSFEATKLKDQEAKKLPLCT